jgi:hypothetical protein
VTRTFSADAEFAFRGGDGCPSGFVPVLFVAQDLDSGHRWSFWGRCPQLAQFIDGHRADLFVSHNAVAEMLYLLRLGIAPPRWWCTMAAWRYVSNAETVVPFGLEEVLAAVGISHCYAGEKHSLQKWIGELRFDPGNPEDLRLIEAYCREDVRTTGLLYQRLAKRVPPAWASFITQYALAQARMEARGLPIDTRTYAALMERKAEVAAQVTADVNVTCPVFIDGQLSRTLFFRWCAGRGISWPLTYDRETGRRRLALDKRSFSAMADRDSFVRRVYEARKTLVQLNARDLAVDGGRHYPGTVILGQATGRTSPTRSILQGPKWYRI